MPSQDRRNPNPLLLDPEFWRGRVAGMGSISRGLLLFPRPDLSTSVVEVVEWSLRSHDGTRLWGLKGHSAFHPTARGVWVREFDGADAPTISLEPVYEGCVDFAMQVKPGRRLEDRVLDVLRVLQAAPGICGIEPSKVHLRAGGDKEPDEFLIASQLVGAGICSLP